MNGPRVVIGAPTYNHAGEAREAFESLLGQTFRDFALVVVDDGSDDGTDEIARRLAAQDSRLTVHRNERRLGMIGNWRRAFEMAVAAHPGAEYFAWASDHDLWHPRWLSVLVAELDAHPSAVLAYPLNTKVQADGSPVDRKPWYFDTAGVRGLSTRLRRTGWNMSAGNMVYGLFRVDPLRRAGVFRRVLVPDRLLLMELTLMGQFRQVKQILWFRRWYGRVFSLKRQRVAFFPDGRPLYAYLPWWLSHTAAFGWNLAVKGSARPQVGRLAAIGLTWQYFWMAIALHIVQQSRGVRLRLVERWPGLRGTRRRLRMALWPWGADAKSARRKAKKAQ